MLTLALLSPLPSRSRPLSCPLSLSLPLSLLPCSPPCSPPYRACVLFPHAVQVMHRDIKPENVFMLDGYAPCAAPVLHCFTHGTTWYHSPPCYHTCGMPDEVLLWA